MVLYFPVIPIRRLRILPLYLLLFFCLFLPFSAKAEDSGKTVRVGWYESSFNFIDASGRRSGYAYEYQQKLAAYTGWHYEYVNASFRHFRMKTESIYKIYQGFLEREKKIGRG